MAQKRDQYQMHLQRIKNAKSRVDSHAPVQKTKKDNNRMHLSYMEMLTALYRKNSRTFTKIRDGELRVDKRFSTDSRAGGDCLDTVQDIPANVLKRYEKIMLSLDQTMIHKLLRPKIFLDLEVKDLRPLGRLIIQLYTEACPAIVLEFVRICSLKENKNFNITKIAVPIWIEGTLGIEDNSNVNIKNLEVDLNTLDHGASAGILSFPSRYVRGNPNNFICFSISLEPLKIFNGKRIAFGRIRRGLWILDELKNYSTALNKPSQEICVFRCGMA